MRRRTNMEGEGLTQRPYRVWENAVPIIKTGDTHHIYLSDEVVSPGYYNELVHIVAHAKEHETVCLHLNTPGGMIDSAFMIIDAINDCEAVVEAHLTGSVASAGTMLALACDVLYIAPHTAFMIHNYSAGISGKGHEMKARQEFTDKSLNETFQTFYKGFLTDKEMEEVIDGKDMWMGAREVNVRWGNRQGYLIDNMVQIVDAGEKDE